MRTCLWLRPIKHSGVVINRIAWFFSCCVFSNEYSIFWFQFAPDYTTKAPGPTHNRHSRVMITNGENKYQKVIKNPGTYMVSWACEFRWDDLCNEV